MADYPVQSSVATTLGTGRHTGILPAARRDALSWKKPARTLLWIYSDGAGQRRGIGLDGLARPGDIFSGVARQVLRRCKLVTS